MLKKMREGEREIPERTTAAAMARKQETIKANCRRSDGRTTEDGCCHIPRRNERNVKLEKILEGEKERALKINPFSHQR